MSPFSGDSDRFWKEKHPLMMEYWDGFMKFYLSWREHPPKTWDGFSGWGLASQARRWLPPPPQPQPTHSSSSWGTSSSSSYADPGKMLKDSGKMRVSGPALKKNMDFRKQNRQKNRNGVASKKTPPVWVTKKPADSLCPASRFLGVGPPQNGIGCPSESLYP